MCAVANIVLVLDQAQSHGTLRWNAKNKGVGGGTLQRVRTIENNGKEDAAALGEESLKAPVWAYSKGPG